VDERSPEKAKPKSQEISGIVSKTLERFASVYVLFCSLFQTPLKGIYKVNIQYTIEYLYNILLSKDSTRNKTKNRYL
jgi:hypothetical protein